MADNFGLRIGVEGEKDFKKSIADINAQMKVLGSEMKLVESQFSSQDKSVEALTARNSVLIKNIDAQKSKIEALQAALKNATTSFGENDKRTQAWAVQLNNAQAELNKMQRELEENNSALNGTGKQMDKAGDAADNMGDKVKQAGKDADEASSHFEGLGTVCKAVAATVAAAFAAVSAAAVAAGKALVDMSTEGAAYEDAVLTESTVTGIATDKLQEYLYAAELVDVSTETLTKSMAKQIQSMKSAQDGSKTMVAAYEALGVEVMDTDGTLRDSDTVYWELIDALGKVENETERDALAMQILGKSAQDLNPLITAGSARMAELGEKAHKAGYVVTDEMLTAYGALDDQIQYLTVGTTAAKNALGTVLLPVLTSLAGEGVDLLGEFTNGILGANGDISKMGDVISNILPKALDAVMTYVPVILDLIGSVVGSIGQVIVDNLPVIVTSASKIILSVLNGLTSALPQIAAGALMLVSELAMGILDNLPALVAIAIEIVATLANGIASALPTLIPDIVSIVVQICDTIIENLPLVLDAALAIVEGLADGILSAIPKLIAALPKLIDGIVKFIQGAIPKIINVGIQLFTALVGALPSIISGIVSSIPMIIEGIVSALMDSIPLIVEAGIPLITSLVSALPTIISAILEAVPLIITALIDTIIGCIPQLMQSGVQLFTSLIQNLPTIITTILTAIPQIITGIITSFIQNVPQVIQAGITLLTSLIKNLPTIIAEIVKAIPQIIAGIVSAFASGVTQMADIGKNLVRGLWEGIQSLASWIWDKVSGWASDLWDGICNFFGIHSPSKKFAELGEYMSQGLGIGFVNEMKDVDKDIISSIPSDFDIDTAAHLRSVADDTAVTVPNVTANREQVTSGVRDISAIGDGYQEQLSLLRQQNSLLRQILEKNISVTIGDDEIGRANSRYEEKRGFVLNTGGFANAY